MMIQERLLHKTSVMLCGMPSTPESHERNRPLAETIIRTAKRAARLNIGALTDQMPDPFVLEGFGWDTLYRLPFPECIFEYRLANSEEAAMVLTQLAEDRITGALLAYPVGAPPPAVGLFATIRVDPEGYELTLPPVGEQRGFDAELLDEEFVGPWAFAMAMLSCKNVATERVLPSRQVRRMYERRGEEPPSEYRIVVKVPGQKQPYTIAGPRRPDEQEMPAHMVRGHFAEYSAERPLFGKYTGRFWIPAHIRGKRDEGHDVQPKEYVVIQALAENERDHA